MKHRILTIVLSLFFIQAVFANKYTWSPGVNFDFFNAPNWSPARINPQANDTLLFDGNDFLSGHVTSAVVNGFISPAQKYLFGGYYEFKNNIRVGFSPGNLSAQGLTWYIPDILINTGSRLGAGSSYSMVLHMSKGRIDGNLDLFANTGSYLHSPGVDVYGKVNLKAYCDLLHDGTVGDPNTTNLIRFRAGSELVLSDQLGGFVLRTAQQFFPNSIIRITGNSICGLAVNSGSLPVLADVIMETAATISLAPYVSVFNITGQMQSLQVAGNVTINNTTPAPIYLTGRGSINISGNLASTRGFVFNGSTGTGTITVGGNFTFSGTCQLSTAYRDTLIVKGDINPTTFIPLRSRPILTEDKPGSAFGGADSCLLWLNGNMLQNLGNFTMQNQVVVKLDNPAGVNFQATHDIPFALLMVNGMAYNSGSNIVTFTNPTATVSGYNSSRFFTGKIRTIGIPDFLYPVGKGSMYRPIKTSDASGTFEVEYIRSNPALTYPQTISTAAPFNIMQINATSELEYWMVNASGTSPTAKIYMNYDAAYSGNIDNNNFQDLRIAGNDGNNWGAHYTTFTSYYPGSNGSFGWMETPIPISFFGPLTWGYAGAGPNPLVPTVPITPLSGSKSLSHPAISVKESAELKTPAETLKLFPNPVISETELAIIVSEAGKQMIVVLNSAGKIVEQFSFTNVKGENRQTLNLSKFPAGQYYIQMICSNGHKAVTGFVKL